ncbi:MAG: response regulator transcription factor [Anaerolineae bacterium]|nr:response regulator transcription factor [Thermoflexales bacterium]MDW8396046.1 response regulator transcription factor [Anaerolineae bacterium]
MPKLLIVEDEKVLLDLLTHHLENEGYTVIGTTNGEEGLELARREQPDLCLLDVMLPGLDGLSLCRILRRESDVAIILLTARAGEIDRVIGLDNGADDYLVKPFSLPELTARIRAALRRSPRRNDTVLRAGNLQVDLAARRVFVDSREVKLSHKEFELLATLMRNKGAVLSREFLINQVWGYDFDGDIRTVDVHIRWLREKIERDPSKPEHLQTVRGVGYRID